MRFRASIAFLFTASALAAACSNTPATKPDGGTNGGCAADLSVGWTNDTLCAATTGGNLGSSCPAVTPPAACIDSRPIAACCAWVADAKTELARAPSSLHYYGQPSGQPTVDVSCVATPATQGTPQTVTLTGYLKVFVGADNDSAGVKVQIYNEGTDGALGTAIGSGVTTDTNSPSRTNTWLSGCGTDGCTERMFTYPGIPTETPLIIHTSDALGAGRWYDFYDYNIYFANGVVSSGDGGAAIVSYDTTAVGTTDPTTVLSTVGTTPTPGKGLLAGEVHDCDDVRLANATVNTDYSSQSGMFYFGSDETNPLPDVTAPSTSDLGLFGGVNYAPNVPIHISAVGLVNGVRTLIGAYTVQVFPNAVSGLSLRGRRPYQHD